MTSMQLHHNVKDCNYFNNLHQHAILPDHQSSVSMESDNAAAGASGEEGEDYKEEDEHTYEGTELPASNLKMGCK